MSSQDLTTAAIVEGCRRGDRLYQKALVDRFSPQLFAVALRYVPDRGYAKDVLQDSLIKIFTRIDQFKGTGSFEGWMTRLLINTALSRLDRNWVKQECSGEALAVSHPVSPCIVDQLATEDIMACIASLPEGYRQVFNLYGVEGFSHREVAGMLGMKEVTCRSYYSRARRMLQALLAHHKIDLRYAG